MGYFLRGCRENVRRFYCVNCLASEYSKWKGVLLASWFCFGVLLGSLVLLLFVGGRMFFCSYRSGFSFVRCFGGSKVCVDSEFWVFSRCRGVKRCIFCFEIFESRLVARGGRVSSILIDGL